MDNNSTRKEEPIEELTEKDLDDFIKAFENNEFKEEKPPRIDSGYKNGDYNNSKVEEELKAIEAEEAEKELEDINLNNFCNKHDEFCDEYDEYDEFQNGHDEFHDDYPHEESTISRSRLKF